MICADVIVEVYMLAMVDGLSGGFGGGQWHAFLYRLFDEEGVWGKRCFWQSGDWDAQGLDSGWNGHLSLLELRSDCRRSTTRFRKAQSLQSQWEKASCLLC